MVLASAFGGQYFTTKTENMAWYHKCVRPKLPRYTFAIVWGIIYACFVISLIHFFQTFEHKLSLVLALSLVLHVGWCYLFFEKRYMKIAAVLLFVLIILGAYLASQSNVDWIKTIFVGYVVWLLFALLLNVLSIKIYLCSIQYNI